MRSRKALTARVAMVLAMLLLTPLAFKSGEGIEPNLACSREHNNPNCQREIDSVCTAGGAPIMNYYTTGAK